MKAKFISKDPKEINRLAKSTDMALFIFELTHNLFRKFENSEIDYAPIQEEIRYQLECNGIDIDDLID